MTTLDEYVVELNEEIDELRAKGNKSGLKNVLAIKTAVLKLLAKECVAEYKELYGEQCIFCLTISVGYEIMKTMERDFWNGIRSLGHVTLLVSLKDLK